MENYRVTFLPMDRVFQAEDGDNLLDAAMKAGVHINASCGGNGACGKCKVMVRKGNIFSPPHQAISPEEYEKGVRLACRTVVHGDAFVEVPLESQVDRMALKRTRETPHILSPADIGQLVAGVDVDPAVFKRYVELPPPATEDNVSDLVRLTRELKAQYGIDDFSVDFGFFKSMSRILREARWKVTVTIVLTRRGYKLINIEAGNRAQENYSIVVDIGTTTICGQLLDLANCSVVRMTEHMENGRDLCTLAESSDYNSQISFGEDVISRIMFSRKKGGVRKLQDAVIKTINNVIKELLASADIKGESISHLAFAGNTVMTHLVLGVDPRYIMLDPYTPAATFFPPVRACDLGIDLSDYIHTYLFPSVSSYVGGDIVAGVLGSGMFQREEITLFMDIGTNGEIVLGNKDWLTCASCSAGPAFEGGGIEFGMRAGKGAIEQVRINPATFEPMIITIGKVKPMGICGSGLIDIVAGLLEAGLIGQNGKFERDARTPRIRAGESGFEYVLSYAHETQIDRDIVVTEVDFDNLIRTKAAIYAGCKVLLDNVGLAFKDIDRVIIAGGFGHYIDLEKAITIGLLPELSLERFLFVGNGSLLGARLLSFSQGFLREAERIARMMTNIELSNSPRFMDEFVAAMFLPHTDQNAFPEVMDRLGSKK
ncbi:MAG: ferredoxin [Syntrophus sp. (in: bacteria)]|nr:ferredoxin [Syntrophus sp. (in: bacteria)]